MKCIVIIRAGVITFIMVAVAWHNSTFDGFVFAENCQMLSPGGPGHSSDPETGTGQERCQVSSDRSDDGTETLRETAACLNKLADETPDNLAIIRELANTYYQLAVQYRKSGQDEQANQADNLARMAIQKSVARLPLNSLIALIQQRDEWSAAAASRLGEVGAEAAPAIPALGLALNDRTYDSVNGKLVSAAGNALGQIGPAAVPVLLKAVTGPATRRQSVALEALTMIEQQPVEAARAMRDSLQDPDAAVRRAAVLALVRLMGEAGVLDDIQAKLNDEDPGVRQAAAYVLGANGKKAKVAIPALIAAARDMNPVVGRVAIAALERIDANSDTVVHSLVEIAGDAQQIQRGAALATLGRIGPAAKAALPMVIAALADEDPAVRIVARQTLRRIDPQFGTTKLGPPFDPVAAGQQDRAVLQVGLGDWPQWGGSRQRNNTPSGVNIPTDWDIKSGRNIKWAVKLGSETYGNPCVANGRVYIGTNNANGYVQRYPTSVDLGVLLCFEEATGRFLWQYSSPKLPTGRVHDWPQQGMPSTPVVDGERLWATTNRGEVVCLDTVGFHDNENDGSFRDETNETPEEADIVWRFDMMKELGVSPHNMSNCSILMAEGVLYVCTSNGVDEGHTDVPTPDAPSFLAMDRVTGKVLWTDNSPGRNILHAQWASASYGLFGGYPQILFPGGDGWLYSFDPNGDGQGGSKILWKFDCNSKESQYVLGGRATRNSLIAFAGIYDGLIYIAPGDDPEHGEGSGRLWCIDPSGKLDGSDVSEDLVVDGEGQIVPRRRLCAFDPTQGERVIPNPNSAVIWKYSQFDSNANGEIDFEEQFHRSLGTAVIKDDILYIADFSGLFHCLDAKCGTVNWTFDTFAACWGSALVVDGKVYLGDEDGDVMIFQHSTDANIALPMGIPLAEINMETSVYSTPVVANNVLYIATRNMLYAIENAPKTAD